MQTRNGSFEFTRSAAEAGAPDAQFHLGLSYSTGAGSVPLDYILAHK